MVMGIHEPSFPAEIISCGNCRDLAYTTEDLHLPGKSENPWSLEWKLPKSPKKNTTLLKPIWSKSLQVPFVTFLGVCTCPFLSTEGYKSWLFSNPAPREESCFPVPKRRQGSLGAFEIKHLRQGSSSRFWRRLVADMSRFLHPFGTDMVECLKTPSEYQKTFRFQASEFC